MSTQRYISTSFWTDKWVRMLDPSERYLYMYLLTNPQTNISGIYQITLDRIAFDTGYDERTLVPMFERFRKAGKASFIDDEWIILPSWPKHQRWEIKATIKKGIESVLNSIPKNVLAHAKELGYTYPIDSLLVGYTYSPSYSDLDSDTDTDTDSDTDYEQTPDKPAKRVTFQKPTLEQVREYCKERENKIDPEQWLDHYEANGWMVGKTKMKDWKATVRNWERNNFESKGKHGYNKPLPVHNQKTMLDLED